MPENMFVRLQEAEKKSVDKDYFRNRNNFITILININNIFSLTSSQSYISISGIEYVCRNFKNAMNRMHVISDDEDDSFYKDMSVYRKVKIYFLENILHEYHEERLKSFTKIKFGINNKMTKKV